MAKHPPPSVDGLAAEVGKRQPFDSPAREAFHAVLRTADLLNRPHEDMFKQHGISRSLYNVLRILLGHEEDPEQQSAVGVPSETVARQMLTRDPDVSRLSKRLIQKGLIARLRDPEDGRVVRLALTPKGRDLARSLIEPSRQLFRQQFAPLDEADIQRLLETLQKLRSNT